MTNVLAERYDGLQSFRDVIINKQTSPFEYRDGWMEASGAPPLSLITISQFIFIYIFFILNTNISLL